MHRDPGTESVLADRANQHGGGAVALAETVLPVPMVQADAEVRAALLEHGFDVVTEIDLAATFKMKLGVERPRAEDLGRLQCGVRVSGRPHRPFGEPCHTVQRRTGGCCWSHTGDGR